MGANCGVVLPAIESREVLEKEDGPDLRFLDPHLSKLLQDLLSLMILPSDLFPVSATMAVDASTCGGGSGGDLERDDLGMRMIFFLGLRVRGTGSSSGAEEMDLLSEGMLSILWKCSSGPCAACSAASSSSSMSSAGRLPNCLDDRSGDGLCEGRGDALRLDEVTTADSGSMPKPTDSRPKTPLSMFVGSPSLLSEQVCPSPHVLPASAQVLRDLALASSPSSVHPVPSAHGGHWQ